MRCRGEKFFSSTCPASTAVSSSSSSANSGTCFNTSGLQDIGHLSAEWDCFSVFQAFDASATRDSFASSKPDDWQGFKKHSAMVGQVGKGGKLGKMLRTKTPWVKTRWPKTISLFDHPDFHVLRRGILLQQVRHSLPPAPQSFRAAKRNDDCQHLLRRRRNHRSFRIARGAAVRANGIGKQRQPFQIQMVFADAFVRFAFASRAKNNVADNVPQVIQPNWQAAPRIPG